MVVACAFFRVFISYEVTKVGYTIGELKQQEVRLLDEKSRLSMNLEKLMTKSHLQLMAYDKIYKNQQSVRAYAQK